MSYSYNFDFEIGSAKDIEKKIIEFLKSFSEDMLLEVDLYVSDYNYQTMIGELFFENSEVESYRNVSLPELEEMIQNDQGVAYSTYFRWNDIHFQFLLTFGNSTEEGDARKLGFSLGFKNDEFLKMEKRDRKKLINDIIIKIFIFNVTFGVVGTEADLVDFERSYSPIPLENNRFDAYFHGEDYRLHISEELYDKFNIGKKTYYLRKELLPSGNI